MCFIESKCVYALNKIKAYSLQRLKRILNSSENSILNIAVSYTGIKSFERSDSYLSEC